jgi:hypothetical protein
VVAISSADDEDRADDKLQTRWVLPGAPMWAMAHIGEDLVPSPDKNQQANWARPEQRISGSPADLERLFQRATESYEPLMRSRAFANEQRFIRIERAMRTGQARELLLALNKG